jgi:CRP/FNR family cyclic AMP-dependent transcriptional regulator
MNLTTHPTLAALSEPSLLALAQRGELRRYRRHTILMEDGDEASSMLLLLEGRLRVFALSHDARPRELTLALLEPGDVAGDTGMATGTRCGTVMALTACCCVVVSARTVQLQLQADPGLAQVLWRLAAHRADQSVQTARRALFSDTYSRLCALLRGEIGHRRAGCDPSFTHAQMAQHIGCSREMVSRIMKDLVSGGYVARLPNRVYRTLRPLPPRW